MICIIQDFPIHSKIQMIFRSLIQRRFSKVYKTAQQAVSGIKDGSFIMVGGFGICGTPMNLIGAVRDSKVKNLKVASNDGGLGDKEGNYEWGLEFLIKNGQIKRMISSYLGSNKHFQRLYLAGQLELQFCPQGTLAEKIKAGGAGIPAFYTHTGVNTMVQTGGIPIKYYKDSFLPEILSEPRETRIINGKKHLLQYSLFADYALVKAQKADHYGNLIFHQSARNFNEDMCTAAQCVIVQTEQIVENSQLNPNHIHIPGLYVNRIFKSDPNNQFSKKKVEKLKYTNPNSPQAENPIRMKIMRRAAKEVKDGMNINLGIGIPTLLPQALGPNIRINVHSQNGVLGVGPYPLPNQQSLDLINAGKETITLLPGGSFFSSSRSFDIIRGGHLDITMLGALQVSKSGDIANWMVPRKMVRGMGGAMDLVASGSKVIVVMQHGDKGEKKLLEKCTLPLTAQGKASMVITEKSVFENRNGKLILTDIAEGVTFQELQDQTGFIIEKADNLRIF